MKNLLTLVFAALLAASSLHAQMKIVSNGNIGIGTETPSEKLHINGSIRGNQSGAVQISTGSGTMTLGPQNTSFAHFYTDTKQFYFGKFVVLGDGKITSYSTNSLQLCTGHTLPNTRMTINASTGNVGIGAPTITAAKLNVGGSIAVNGTVMITSDIRLKENVKAMDISYNKLAMLQPITFNYNMKLYDPDQNIKADTVNTEADLIAKKLNEEFNQKTRFGFSAQELQKVFPELVTENDEGFLSVDYIGLIPILVEAMKEQQVKIEQLEKKVAALTRQKTITQ